MDLYEALKERRSCRNYSPEPIDEDVVEKILESAVWAPSPLNTQPWEFVVVMNPAVKDQIIAEAQRCCQWAIEESGWKWLKGYKMDFLRQVPVMVAVVGNPEKTGVDQFMTDGSTGYQHACAAAIQNMILAAHAEGLGSLWFTFYDKTAVKEILAVEDNKVPIAIVCMGKAAGDPVSAPRKSALKKTRFIR